MDSTTVAGIYLKHAPPTAPAGDRPPLLLVHGAGHGAWCWRNWMEALPQRGWDCWALSLRNHPGSAPVDAETYRARLTVDDYAADVATAAGHIGRPVVVVGHSLGGIVAQAHAARAEAAALVLLASVPPGAFAPIRQAPVPTDRDYLLSPEVACAHYFLRPEAVGAAALMARLVPESPAVMNHYSLGEGYPVSPAAIRCPVLVVSAEQDRSVVPRDRRLADYYGADYLLAEDIGHDLMLDAGWERPLARVEAWLAERFPAG